MNPIIHRCCFVIISLYLISLGLPIRPDIPMVILSSAGILLALIDNHRPAILPLIMYMFLPFLISMGLSLVISANIRQSLLLSISFIPGILLFFLIIETIDTEKKIYQIYLVLSVLGLLISVEALRTAIYLKQAIPSTWIKNMGNPNILVPNDLILLIILIPFSLSLIQSKTPVIFKIISGISILLSICIISIYQSRGGLILAGISFILTITLSKSYKMFILCVIGVAVALTADIISGSHIMSKFTDSWNTRIVYWLIAWAMFKDAPILGHGLHNYGFLSNEYKHRITIPDWVTVDDRFAPWAHNLYLEILSEQGIVGLLCFIVLLSYAFKCAWKSAKSSNKQISLSGIGALLSLSIFSIAAMFELSFVRHWVVVIFFGIMGIIVSLFHQQSMQKENSNDN